MKTKLIFTISLIMLVLAINIGAGCTEKSIETKPDNFQSLIGKWIAKRSVYNITKQDGTTLQSVTEIDPNSLSIIWQFFDDGRLLVSKNGGYDQLRWNLKVISTDAQNIQAGKLTIIGESTKALAASIGQSGDLVYDISTTVVEGQSVKMSLDLDVTKIGPYKKNILASIYHKL